VALPDNYLAWQQVALQTFHQKREQYGESWQALSFPSLIDLLVIKARRLWTLYGQQRSDKPATGESPTADWIALINYGTLSIATLEQAPSIMHAISNILQQAQETLEDKNTDYGDAWMAMRPLAFVEFILMKLERIRSMDHEPAQHLLAIRDNLIDIINYAILFLCKYGAATHTP